MKLDLLETSLRRTSGPKSITEKIVKGQVDRLHWVT